MAFAQLTGLDSIRAVHVCLHALRIKRFMDESENAVKTQIWCAVASHARIAIIKKELTLDASLFNCLRILSVSIFEKTRHSCALQPVARRIPTPALVNQLNLLGY